MRSASTNLTQLSYSTMPSTVQHSSDEVNFLPMWGTKLFAPYDIKTGQFCGSHHRQKYQEKRRRVPLVQRIRYYGPRKQTYIASISRASNSSTSLSHRLDIAQIASQSAKFLRPIMGAAVSVPTSNIWSRWDVVFAMMESIGRTDLCISWEGVLAATCGLFTLEGFQSVTGVAWRDVEAEFEDEDVMETEEFDARAQRPSHADKDAQFPDENGERPSPGSKHTQSYRRDALSMNPMTCGRLIVNLVEKQICKPFADKLEKGWNLEEMNAPLLELLEPRKAMEELAIDFYNHMRQNPVAGAATFIKESTETENQSWALNSAEECQAFWQCQRGKEVLLRKGVHKGNRPSGDKYRKQGVNVPNDGTGPGSDLAEAGL